MRKIFYLGILLILYGCSSEMKYSTAKIFELQRKGYSVLYNQKKVNFHNIYLDSQNIVSVKKNRKNRFIIIEPKTKNAEFLSIEDLVKLYGEGKLIEPGFVVIDSVMNWEINEILIEKSAIREVILLDAEKLNEEEKKKYPARYYQGDVILVNIK